MTSIVFQDLNLQGDINTVIIGEKGLLIQSKISATFKLTETIFDDRDFVQISQNLLLTEYENKTSRNLPFRVDNIQEAAKKYVTSKDNRIVLVAKTKQEAFMGALAIARNWHPYNKKADAATRTIYVQLSVQDGSTVDLKELQYLSDSIRKAQLLMDTPCSELSTTDYVKEAKKLVQELAKFSKDVGIKVIDGEDLKKSFGGIYGVGKAATNQPALVVLSYLPNGAEKTIALVGKGIVYDTGGLSIKSTTGMCGMKHDMGGSAACFGAFSGLVKSGVKKNVYALLCLAENAVGPNSVRNDDILYMYSGKTVEVNNTDAEGRLVLADGVAYASKHLNPDIVVDIATLTGAQLICTGLKHAGIVTANESVEQQIIEAGKSSGDYVFPMLYCPELLMKLFNSKVADMKNSVSDRSNAQSSCAAHFVEQHLDADYKGQWLHIDMAGPGTQNEQATGFGVTLLYQFVQNY